jgi:hypothetical protein
LRQSFQTRAWSLGNQSCESRARIRQFRRLRGRGPSAGPRPRLAAREKSADFSKACSENYVRALRSGCARAGRSERGGPAVGRCSLVPQRGHCQSAAVRSQHLKAHTEYLKPSLAAERPRTPRLGRMPCRFGQGPSEARLEYGALRSQDDVPIGNGPRSRSRLRSFPGTSLGVLALPARQGRTNGCTYS